MASGKSTPAGDAREGRRDTAPDPDEIPRAGADTYVDENEDARGTYVDENDGPPLESAARRSMSDSLDYEDVGPTQVSGELSLDDGGTTDQGEQARARARAVDAFELPREGDTIDGRYVIERVVGTGASGVVYEASHRLIGKRIAIKCLHPQMSTSPVAVQRLFREARISAALKHPNVVEVFDAGRDGDLYFLTMELLEGEPLSAFLARGPHPVEEIRRIFLAMMDGVAAVHEAGVVHRDLKPDNVFLVPSGEGPPVPKVLDFGVSKLYQPDRAQITALGMTMGTPYYMAPEQVTDSRSVDVRADVYSLGVMLYEALCGALPYEGETLLEIFTHALEGRPPRLRERRPEVPGSLEAIIARAMCADREQRHASVKEMRAALAAVPFDGSERDEDWNDLSEPWMLDPNAGKHEVAPLESAPTQVGIPKGSTVVMQQPVAATPSEGRAAPPPARLPDVRLLAIAGAAALVLLGAAAAIAFAVFG